MKTDKYIKIVYQTEPIGKHKIILYLTTFDIEAFEKDQIQEKRVARVFEFEESDLETPDFLEGLSKNLNTWVKGYYEPYVEELKSLIKTKKIMEQSVDLNARNIKNSDNVHCNIVYGNITNCDNIYCNEIKGNVVNCDKIIYKKESE